MAFALPYRWDCASAAVDQQTKRSRYRSWLRMRLLRGGFGGRSEIGRIYEELVRFGIESHVARAELGFHSFNHAEFIRGILVKDMQSTLSRGDEKQAGGRFEDIRIYTGANRKSQDNLARVHIHDGKQFVATAYKQPVMLHVEIDRRGLFGRSNRPTRLHRIGLRIDGHDFVFVLDVVVDRAMPIGNGILGASTDWDGGNDRQRPRINHRSIVGLSIHGENMLGSGI